MTNEFSRSHSRVSVTAVPNERPAETDSSTPLRTHLRIEADGGERDRRGRPLRRSVERSNGGTVDGDNPALATYTNEEYGYSLDYPDGWSVEIDAGGGVTFEDTTSMAGAVVFLDTNSSDDLATYADRFQTNLAADDHVHDLERLDRRTVRLPSSHRGRIVECAYVGDTPDERWRLTYLFVVDDDTGYTVGIDWTADTGFEEIARTVVESFTLTTDSTE